MEEENKKLQTKVNNLKQKLKENLKTINSLENEMEEIKLNKNNLSMDETPGEHLWFDVKKSSIPNSGRGVFAKKSFKIGDKVMSSPIIRFPVSDLNKNAVLRSYIGNVGDGTGFLTMDYQGLVNTINPELCNVQATWRLSDGYSDFIAIRNIKEGDELFQSYGNPNKVN